MKKPILAFLPSLVVITFCLFIDGCRREIDIPVLAGNPGNPRFNLKFTNEKNVDLDLYVLDPNGETIYYSNKRARKSSAQLDVDCLCGSCPQGPNENIFWSLTEQSPRGKYEFWVNYYRACTSPLQPSDFTIRVLNDSKSQPLVFMAQATLATYKGNSTIWVYDTETGKVTVK